MKSRRNRLIRNWEDIKQISQCLTNRLLFWNLVYFDREWLKEHYYDEDIVIINSDADT